MRARRRALVYRGGGPSLVPRGFGDPRAARRGFPADRGIAARRGGALTGLPVRFLLDTNIVSDLVRNPGGRAASRIAEIGEAMVCTSIIVAAELRYGAARRNSARLTGPLEAVLGELEIL